MHPFHSLIHQSPSSFFFSCLLFPHCSEYRPTGIAVFSSKVSRDRSRKRSAVVFIARARKAERGATGRMVRKKRPAENGRGRKARKEKQMRLDATASTRGWGWRRKRRRMQPVMRMVCKKSRVVFLFLSFLFFPPRTFSARKNLSKKRPLLKEHESRTGEIYRTWVSFIIAFPLPGSYWDIYNRRVKNKSKWKREKSSFGNLSTINLSAARTLNGSATNSELKIIPQAKVSQFFHKMLL